MNNYEFKKTHHGRFLGIPVWLDMTDEQAPAIQAKFGFVGEFAMDIMERLFGCFIWCQTSIDPYYEPTFPILVLREVEDA